jgi:hypothetical protein
VLGIDPGLEKSAWALVAFGDARPHLLATGEALTPELDPEALRRGLDRLLLELLGRPSPCAVAVESARGRVAKGRDADPVLRDASMGGRVAGYLLSALPRCAVLELPADTDRQGYSWRGLLGCSGMVDAGIRLHLRQFLGPMPGKQSHVVDAAGVALAVGLRLVQRGMTGDHAPADLAEAFYRLSPLEQGILDTLKGQRAERKKGRAVLKKATLLGHEIDPAVLKRPRRKA